MDWRDPSRNYNITRDWNKAQGFGDVADETAMIRRDINLRRVSIENSSPDSSIGIGITAYPSEIVPKIQFYLKPGEIKHVGINTIGGPMQYVWMLDINTKLPVGQPVAFRTDCNQFVLRNGLNKWFVHCFQKTGYKGS